MTVSRADLRKYADVIRFWNAKFDTQSIAERLDLPEWLVARWVANFRDMVRDVA
jgi:hypothetical protein